MTLVRNLVLRVNLQLQVLIRRTYSMISQLVLSGSVFTRLTRITYVIVNLPQAIQILTNIPLISQRKNLYQFLSSFYPFTWVLC